MIKVDLDLDCFDESTPGDLTSGKMMLQGDPNKVLNEVAALVKYAIILMKEPAIRAIEDGISQAMEELNND